MRWSMLSKAAVERNEESKVTRVGVMEKAAKCSKETRFGCLVEVWRRDDRRQLVASVGWRWRDAGSSIIVGILITTKQQCLYKLSG